MQKNATLLNDANHFFERMKILIYIPIKTKYGERKKKERERVIFLQLSPFKMS